jgi:hypothetical protein
MSSTKKLVPLSFSVYDFFHYFPVPITNIMYAFHSFPVLDKQNLAFQLIYQDLNTNNAKIKFEQSLDNINFDDIVDASGNPILIDLKMSDTSVTINLFNINTAHIRFTLIFNNLTSGSFTYYTYITN